MAAIFNSLFWPVSLSTQNKVRLGSFCSPHLKDWGSILHQSNFHSIKHRLHSRQYPRLVDLFTVAASGSLCILLACLDASAVPSFSINSTTSLPDSETQNMALGMEVEILIPIPVGAENEWGIQNIIYASAPELAMSMKKKENFKPFADNQTKCPQWNLNEYEIVVPNLPRKPNSRSLPPHGYYWINAQNSSFPWNPNNFHRADSFARRVGTGNRKLIRPTDGNILYFECFSL